MKKQYVLNSSNKMNLKETYTAVFLIGMCIAAALITFLIIGISERIKNTEKNDILIESNNIEDIEVLGKGEFDDIVSEKSGAEPVLTQSVKSTESVIPEDENRKSIEETNAITEEVDSSFIIPCEGEIIYNFSPTVPLYSKTLDDWRVHNGIDIHVPMGTEVCCIGDGTIHDIYDDLRFGSTVVVLHDNDLRSVYSNLDGNIFYKAGDKIKKGSVISHVGDTALFETVADTHLHFELIRLGSYVNPMDYLSFK